ncbi:6057_t:CDS:2 [Funneliformis caledonium]|uniref:6057_t:CDS:1 n=1 Tax=Funneliformis caledonium TaxID=1117310 RepID=A0A9N9NER8_9GLOM|nr:6057_t:CDS:2 [Funneliformis caledonium]
MPAFGIKYPNKLMQIISYQSLEDNARLSRISPNRYDIEFYEMMKEEFWLPQNRRWLEYRNQSRRRENMKERSREKSSSSLSRSKSRRKNRLRKSRSRLEVDQKEKIRG